MIATDQPSKGCSEPFIASFTLYLVGQDLAHQSRALEKQLGEIIDEGVRNLVLDLGACSVANSDGLRVLVETHRRLDERGGSLLLRRPPPHLLRLFQLTRLDAYLSVA